MYKREYYYTKWKKENKKKHRSNTIIVIRTRPAHCQCRSELPSSQDSGHPVNNAAGSLTLHPIPLGAEQCGVVQKQKTRRRRAS